MSAVIAAYCNGVAEMDECGHDISRNCTKIFTMFEMFWIAKTLLSTSGACQSMFNTPPSIDFYTTSPMLWIGMRSTKVTFSTRESWFNVQSAPGALMRREGRPLV
jgi:hypothetical protein